MQSQPVKNNYAEVRSIKVIYDLGSKQIYYSNSKEHRFHFDFCSNVLHAYSTLEEFNRVEYSNSNQRRFAIANLNLYTASDLYTLEFFPDDEIRTSNVVEFFAKVKRTVYFGDRLRIADNNWHTAEWRKNNTLSFISPDELYAGQTFQSMKEGIAYGYLRFFEDEKTMQEEIGANDIAVLNNLPNNLPLCAATITSVFQTPLCHINILSQNRNTPNCMVKDAFTNAALLKYKDQLVLMKVSRDTLEVTAATPARAQKFWDKSKRKKLIALNCDNGFRRIAEMKDLSIKSIRIVGGKAANMGELAKVKLKKGQRLPIPEIVFAIPFYFYNQHIKEHHIDTMITALLQDKIMMSDKKLLGAKLKQIRESIEDAPLDDSLIKMVTVRIGDAHAINFRFRSSTNAEDVPGFNGAGLYDSKTGNVDNPKRPVDKAIKEVWASLWKMRAFEERVFFNIDQTDLAMGILVNKAFGTEEANGVAVTRNLYRDDYPAYTINVQKGEESIVQPDDSIRAEQFLVNLSLAVTGTNDIAVDYICHSSLQPGRPLMTKSEIRQLTQYLQAIKDHFWKVYPRKRNSTYNNFGMDVEFKLDAGTRKIFIKQARVY